MIVYQLVYNWRVNRSYDADAFLTTAIGEVASFFGEGRMSYIRNSNGPFLTNLHEVLLGDNG
jgi:hypothetical protein